MGCTGTVITFLSFQAGTSLVASLDDANGDATGATSDVVEIQPSNNTSCLPACGSSSAPAMPYTLHDELLVSAVQCGIQLNRGG